MKIKTDVGENIDTNYFNELKEKLKNVEENGKELLL
jgi:hypothetical protein